MLVAVVNPGGDRDGEQIRNHPKFQQDGRRDGHTGEAKVPNGQLLRGGKADIHRYIEQLGHQVSGHEVRAQRLAGK